MIAFRTKFVPPHPGRAPRTGLGLVCGLGLVVGLATGSQVVAGSRDDEGMTRALRRIQYGMSTSVAATRAYEAAKALHRQSPGRPDLAWAFARACFDRCEALASKPVRISVAHEGVEACRTALKTFPAEAGCHYYLAMNLGILAQSQPLRALGHVRDMESAWQASRLLEPAFDHAGADRSLGMLYAECPPPPLGVGSRSKARQHLSKAVELEPVHPGNRLEWIGYLLKDGEPAAARREFEALQQALPAARERFAGEAWQPTWATWEARMETFGKRLAHGRTKDTKASGS